MATREGRRNTTETVTQGERQSGPETRHSTGAGKTRRREKAGRTPGWRETGGNRKKGLNWKSRSTKQQGGGAGRRLVGRKDKNHPGRATPHDMLHYTHQDRNASSEVSGPAPEGDGQREPRGPSPIAGRHNPTRPRGRRAK
ncbi:hypothetical protein Tco_0561870 [Tanacetum coccineum]